MDRIAPPAPRTAPVFSVVIPVYRTEAFIADLLGDFAAISETARQRFGVAMEFVFVVDASPDRSYERLQEVLPQAPFASQLLLHGRNFGSFAAIRTGLQAGRGDYFAAIAADRQEPAELLLQFLSVLLDGEHDVVVGTRISRQDPALSKAMSSLFWRMYRRLIIRDMPQGGVDVFACTSWFRGELLKLREAHSSLVGLIFWLGCRRAEIGYERRERRHGRSAWTLGKKITYLLDSVFSFSDLPIRVLSGLGMVGIACSLVLGCVVIAMKILGDIPVPGYAATLITIVFFGGVNALGLGVVGAYAWRTYENTKQRMLAVVHRQHSFAGTLPHETDAP